MKYSWCLGITLDCYFVEHTCNLRENCVYYINDIFSRFKRDELEDDFLLNEPGKPCSYFYPKATTGKEKCDEVSFDFLL